MRSAAVNPAGWPAMPRPDGTGPDVMVPGDPSGTARETGGITLGVEEEFILLDPSAGAAVPVGPDLARMLGGEPGVQQELMRFQVETATPVCTSLDDLGRELARLRRLAADAAASLGCRLVAAGTAPYRTPGLAAVTDQPRYRDLARRYGPLAVQPAAPAAATCTSGFPPATSASRCWPGCGPGLPRCSPSPSTHRSRAAATPAGRARGTGPGHAGRPRRRPRCGRTPPPTMRRSAASSGAARRPMSGASTSWHGLSPRYPTVEVRVADVCLDAGTAVLLGGLTRALVATALAEARQGIPVPAAPARSVNAALAAAARRGLAGPGVDPFTGQPADARSLRSRLLDHAYPALSDRGDAQTITRPASAR